MARTKPASRFPRRPAPASWPNNINIGNNRSPRFIAPRATQQHRRRDPALAAAKAKQRREKFFADRKAARTQARANKKAVRLQSFGLTDAYPFPIQHLSKTQANFPTEDDIDWGKIPSRLVLPQPPLPKMGPTGPSQAPLRRPRLRRTKRILHLAQNAPPHRTHLSL